MRIDLSKYLFHWVRGEDEKSTFRKFIQILNSDYLVPSSKYIKGGHEVVCFTETPAQIFHSEKTEFGQFGFAFRKRYLFDNGARPVIYQPKEEDNLVDESIHWRLVTFDISDKQDTYSDWTQEREWRVPRAVDLLSSETILYLPSETYREAVQKERAEHLTQMEDVYVMLGAFPEGVDYFSQELGWPVKCLDDE